MAKLKPETINLSQINGGNEFTLVDGVSPEAINAPLRASAFAQELARNQPDISEIGGSGTPEVKIIDIEKGTPKLKFKHLVNGGVVGTEVEANPTIDENAEELTSIKINKVDYKIVGGGTTVTVGGEAVETFNADTKQNKLTAGDNIIIDSNGKISAITDLNYYSHTLNFVRGNLINCTIEGVINKETKINNFDEFASSIPTIKKVSGKAVLYTNTEYETEYEIDSIRNDTSFVSVLFANPPEHPFGENNPSYLLGKYLHKLTITGNKEDFADIIETVTVYVANNSDARITSMQNYIGYGLYNIANNRKPFIKFLSLSDGSQYIALYSKSSDSEFTRENIMDIGIVDEEVLPISFNDIVGGIYDESTDKTLTIENAPADAKAVGDKFKEVEEKLKNLPSGGGGTTVTVGGEAVETFNADTKLDKITNTSSTRQVYATSNGQQKMMFISTNGNPDWLVAYGNDSQGDNKPTGTGKILSQEPTKPYQVANKIYVDNLALYKHNITLTGKYYPLGEQGNFEVYDTIVIRGYFISKSSTLMTLQDVIDVSVEGEQYISGYELGMVGISSYGEYIAGMNVWSGIIRKLWYGKYWANIDKEQLNLFDNDEGTPFITLFEPQIADTLGD